METLDGEVGMVALLLIIIIILSEVVLSLPDLDGAQQVMRSTAEQSVASIWQVND